MIGPIKIVPMGQNMLAMYGRAVDAEDIENGGVSTAVVEGVPCIVFGTSLLIPVEAINTKATNQIVIHLVGGSPENLVATDFFSYTLDQRMLIKLELWQEMQSIAA